MNKKISKNKRNLFQNKTNSINFIILLLFFVRKYNKQIKKIISVEVISSKSVPGWPSHEANISKGKIKTTQTKINKINNGKIDLRLIFTFIKIK